MVQGLTKSEFIVMGDGYSEEPCLKLSLRDPGEKKAFNFFKGLQWRLFEKLIRP